MMAWKMAATHMASSTRVQTSQMRNSTVGYVEFGRTSHQILVPSGMVFVRGDHLSQPGRRGMGAGGDDLEAVFASQLHDGTSQAHQFGAQLSRCLADVGADLDHGLVQLGFDLLEQ